MDSDRLEILLQRRWDQVLTSEERRELERMLLESTRARAAFWESARWHALIRQWGEAAWGTNGEPGVVRAASSTRDAGWMGRESGFRWGWALAGVVVGLLVAAGFRLDWARPTAGAASSGTSKGATTVESPNGVALLTKMLGTDWQGTAGAGHAGESLTPGRILLGSGVVELETLRGARLVIEGPADVELVAENEVVLHHGRLRVVVPESARGLLVRSSRFLLVDRSGAFGCVVNEQGGTVIHVFQGSVEVTDRVRDTRHVLQAGQSRTLAAAGGDDGVADPSMFVSDAELNRRVEEQARFRLEQWRAFGQALDRRDDVRVHLDFEDGRRGTRLLSNRARHAAPGSGASLVGCDWVEGRWRGKGAVEFKHQSDRLWLNVPELLESVTFLAWVRVDSLPYSMHALLTAEGPGGKVRWALREDGALALGVQVPNDGRGWLIHRSDRKVRPQQLGTWLCLVTVIQGDGTVTHYIDGEPAGEGRLTEYTPAKLGRCEIGNAASAPGNAASSRPAENGTTAEPPRNFIGRLDEFAIFSAALDAGEIRRLHDQGRGRGPTISSNDAPYASP